MLKKKFDILNQIDIDDINKVYQDNFEETKVVVDAVHEVAADGLRDAVEREAVRAPMSLSWLGPVWRKTCGKTSIFAAARPVAAAACLR